MKLGKPMRKNNLIGKRVEWKFESQVGFGTLMAVDCDDTSVFHLVQREDDGGWILEMSHNNPCHKKAREQGVKDGTENLYWVSKYKVVDKHKHKYTLICKCGKEK